MSISTAALLGLIDHMFGVCHGLTKLAQFILREIVNA